MLLSTKANLERRPHSMEVLLFAIAVQVLAGTFALAFSKFPRVATAVGTAGAVLGCFAALTPALRTLFGGANLSLRWAWDVSHGAFCVELDPLSAVFLLPVLVLSVLAAIYGGHYLLHDRHRKSLGGPWFFCNLFVSGMILVLLARTAFLFLLAWEVMSLSAFCLVTLEHEKSEVRQAGWVYLIATHFGVAFLFLAFAVLGRNAGRLEFEAFRTAPALTAGTSALIFAFALIGFGAKAGLVPFHVWLPEAHPAAPSHVSALMSGVMIKMGFYGILRTLTFLGPPALWWGPTLAGVGLLTGIVGISLALQQRDVKRVLAYSSIENMGLICLAMGVSLWGWASDDRTLAVIGMTAALLHIWNHALMKGLMFFGAGSVLHATHTKDMEKLGGLMKTMPYTASMMTVGAVAIAALPPMNGFVSKWLIYMGLLKWGFATNDSRSLAALFAVGLLALIGGLTAVSFVRMIGIVMLGSPRSETARTAHESSFWLIMPMAFLVVLCFGSALFPLIVAAAVAAPLDQILGRGAAQTFLELEATDIPLAMIGNLNMSIVIGGAALALVWALRLRQSVRVNQPTWGCGYVEPTPRMQYTGRSFGEMMADHLLPRFLRPRIVQHAPRGLFPSKSEFGTEYLDPVRHKIYEPFFYGCADKFSALRILQQGKVHVYLIYILLVVVGTLTWLSLRSSWGTP